METYIFTCWKYYPMMLKSFDMLFSIPFLIMLLTQVCLSFCTNWWFRSKNYEILNVVTFKHGQDNSCQKFKAYNKTLSAVFNFLLKDSHVKNEIKNFEKKINMVSYWKYNGYFKRFVNKIMTINMNKHRKHKI